MDIAGLISSFSTGTYTVTRTTAVPPVRGRAQDGVESTLTITASVSPAVGLALEKLKEGRNSRQSRTLFTATELFVGGPGEAYEADHIEIDGTDWQVEEVQTWVDSLTGAIGYKCTVLEA